MNEKIKEILDRIEATFETTENNSFVKFKWLDYKQLLDYITNLQQEIQKKNAYIKYLEERVPKYNGKKFYGIERDDENEK